MTTKLFEPVKAVRAAAADVGKASGAGRCQEFTFWQTSGGQRCAPFCCSACAMWLHEAGYDFDDGHNHVWDDRWEWNVTLARLCGQDINIWRDRTYHAQAGDLVVLEFGVADQHIGMVVSQRGPGQPVATIEGNTGGGRVLARTRYMGNVRGFIATTRSGQLKTGASVPTPGEIKNEITRGNESMIFYKPGLNTDNTPTAVQFSGGAVLVYNSGGKNPFTTGKLVPFGGAGHLWIPAVGPNEKVAGLTDRNPDGTRRTGGLDMLTVLPDRHPRHRLMWS